MNERQFDELMREAAPQFRSPPEPPVEMMWARIEREHFGSPARSGGGNGLQRMIPAMGIAAALLLGIGIGWYSARTFAAGDQHLPTASVAAELEFHVEPDPYQLVTTRYLGQMTALLVALPARREARGDSLLTAQAGELLSTTRLLLDSPAAADPELRNLMNDLELVLAQIIGLSARRGAESLEMITDALEQRDVLPRLHTAVLLASSN
jgi:hypothetical protein